MKRTLSLDYALGDGWLAPWLDGLRKGRAIASTCSTCGLARFPPLRTCPDCRTSSDGWITLSGGATILFRTQGADGDFAMVRFDGASGAAIARAELLPSEAGRAVLARCADDPPFLSLDPEPRT
jgi:uncharacterized OB-fold protein